MASIRLDDTDTGMRNYFEKYAEGKNKFPNKLAHERKSQVIAIVTAAKVDKEGRRPYGVEYQFCSIPEYKKLGE